MKRNALAVVARSRRAPTMKHRLAGRGGSRNDYADALAELQDADGLEMGYIDSDLLGELCPIGCKHRDDSCKIGGKPEVPVYCMKCAMPKNHGPTSQLCCCDGL